MIIGIEAERANHPVKTGVEHYAKQLILQLAKIDSQNQYILYLRTNPEDWFLKLPSNFKIKILGYGFLKFPYLWTQIRLSFEMLFRAPDVLLVPAASLPLIHPKKSFITVHDVAWKIYPETFKTLKRWYLEFTAWFASKYAYGLIAVSEATKKDLQKFYKVNSNKIFVVYHGYESAKQGEEAELEDSKVKDKLPDQYIVFLGTIQPRKNIIGLIDAFVELKNEQPELPHKLVIAGKIGWKPEETLEKFSNPDIVYLGHVTDNDRFTILKKASLYVLPSFYEGFGMPILEAFSVGTPVATSNISSMPEVAQEAAVYFNPLEKVEIKKAIASVLNDKAFAQQLSDSGYKRLSFFSWEKCAKETLKVLISV